MQNVLLVGVVGLAGALVLISIIISRIIYICPPNAVLIFSGGHRKIAGDERVIGYRVVQGGRGLRIPLIEVVDRMDLTNMIIELRVQGAYSRGGIPLNVQGVANVKVSSKTVQLANAVERFLGNDARADHGRGARDARGQPARRAVDADARGGQPGSREVRGRAAPRGRSRSRAARPRARHAQDPARVR